MLKAMIMLNLSHAHSELDNLQTSVEASLEKASEMFRVVNVGSCALFAFEGSLWQHVPGS